LLKSPFCPEKMKKEGGERVGAAPSLEEEEILGKRRN